MIKLQCKGAKRVIYLLAFMVLDEFRYNGLYTAERDENGYLPEELEKAQSEEQKYFITPKKRWELLEYLIKSLNGY